MGVWGGALAQVMDGQNIRGQKHLVGLCLVTYLNLPTLECKLLEMNPLSSAWPPHPPGIICGQVYRGATCAFRPTRISARK